MLGIKVLDVMLVSSERSDGNTQRIKCVPTALFTFALKICAMCSKTWRKHAAIAAR